MATRYQIISTKDKASGAEVDTGTDDVKYVTSKAMEDSSYVKSLSIPVKATGAEINTGTDDAKFATPKAIADSNLSFTDGIETFTGAKTFNDGKLLIAGATSGSISLKAEANASGTINFPNVTTDTVVMLDLLQTVTKKSLTTPYITGTPSTMASGQFGFNSTDLSIMVSNLSTVEEIYTSGWKSFTPSWTNLTVGNSTNTGYYCRTGKLISAHGQFILGNTGSIGTNVTLTLPVTISSNYPSNFTPIGYFRAAVSGTGYTGLIGHTGLLLLTKTDATYATGANVTATVPATWATNDNIQYSIYYEAA